MTEHDYYNHANFPHYVCDHGNWEIYRNDKGHCAAIAKPSKEGCRSSHFGDMNYVRVTLHDELQEAFRSTVYLSDA